MKTKAKILICYNSPVSIYSVYNGKPVSHSGAENDLSEKSFLKEIHIVEKSLSKYFTEVLSLPIDKNVKRTIANITEINPQVIFNFVESVEGVAEFEWCVAGLFGLLGYQFTGCVPSSLGNCLNKARTKSILVAQGIQTPEYRVFKASRRFTKKDIHFDYPIILKPLREDASIGISEFSVVRNYTEFRKQFKFLTETYRQDIIAEKYINGRELNVGILGNEVLPLSEISFAGLPSNLPKIVTYDGKWMENSTYYNHTVPVCPSKLNSKIKKKVESVALAAFEAMNCRDYARVDIRLDKNDNPFVIEVNPNPDISTDAGFTRAAAAKGIKHVELLYTIANFALTRKIIDDTKVKAG